MTINRTNQAWTMDITYVPMARGFVYLSAGVKQVEEEIARFGRTEIMNTRPW